MFDDDSEVMEEIKRKKEMQRQTFGKVINKKKVNNWNKNKQY